MTFSGFICLVQKHTADCLDFFMLKMMDVWIVSEKIINLSFRLINHIYHEVNNYEI